MNKAEFKKRLADIFPKEGCDPEESHDSGDELLVEALESEGYDLTDFKNATKWYS